MGEKLNKILNALGLEFKPRGWMWMLRNAHESMFGKGAEEQGKFKYLMLKLTNMASKILDTLQTSLNKETQATGKQLEKEANKAKKEMGKAENSAASRGNMGAKAAEASKSAAKAAKPILSTDVSATIAQASMAAAGKGGQALVSGKGLDAKMPDLGR